MNAITAAEADDLFLHAVEIMELLDDGTPAHRAIPRAVLTRGDALHMLGAFVAILSEHYPVPASASVFDLAASYYREKH